MTTGEAVTASRGSKASPAARRKLAAILGARSRKHRKEYRRFSDELETLLGTPGQTTLSKAGLKALARLHAALDGVRDDVDAVRHGGDERRTLLKALDSASDAYGVLESALRRPLSTTSVAQVKAAGQTLEPRERGVQARLEETRMSHWLDRLAADAAADPPRGSRATATPARTETVETTMTRRTTLRAAAAMTLAAAPLAALAERAAASPSARAADACDACHANVKRAFVKAETACVKLWLPGLVFAPALLLGTSCTLAVSAVSLADKLDCYASDACARRPGGGNGGGSPPTQPPPPASGCPAGWGQCPGPAHKPPNCLPPGYTCCGAGGQCPPSYNCCTSGAASFCSSKRC